MSDKNQKKKILVLIPPATGHLSTVVCIVNELVQYRNVEVIFYSNEPFRSLIEKTGAQFKAYSSFDMRLFDDQDDEFDVMSFLIGWKELSKDILPELISITEQEKPDLIFFDHMSLHAKYLASYLKIKNKKKELPFKCPKFVMIYSTFALMHGIFPTKNDLKKANSKITLNMLVGLVRLTLKQRKINKQFGLDITLDPRKMYDPIDEINMCTILAEIQPYSEKMLDRIKFPGCCVTEKVRNFESNDPILNDILIRYAPVNPLFLNQSENERSNKNKRMVYVSLGTVFNKKV